MSKIIFLGTDLHGPPTELAAKLVKTIQKSFPNSHLLSLEYRKPFFKQDNCTIIKKKSYNVKIKRFYQGIKLPIELIKLKTKGYDTILSFWTAGSKYHEWLFALMKKNGFRILFTVLNQVNDSKRINLNVLKLCDEVIVQSQRSYDKLKTEIPENRLTLIYPGVDLSKFKPANKKYDLIIPSVPYDPKEFDSRGINIILDIIRDEKLSAVIIFRSKDSYNEVRQRGLKRVKLINRALSDNELSEIMGKCRVMPLFYNDSPEVPLSAVEGLASGCAIVCSDKIGVSELITKNNVGAIVCSKFELEKLIKKFVRKEVSKKSRKLAEIHFKSGKMVTKYHSIIYSHS